MSTLKRFAGQTAIYGLSTIASRVLNFFLTPVYIAQYPPSEYAVLIELFAWASIINAILAFGMETTFFRFATKYADRRNVVYNNAFFAIAALAVFFLLIVLSGAHRITELMQPLSQKRGDYHTYVIMFGVLLMMDALAVIPFARVRAEGRPVRYGWIKSLNILVFIGLNLFFIFGIPKIIDSQGPGYQWITGHFRREWVGYVFLANLIASLLTLILLLPEIWKLSFSFSRKMFGEMFGYSWPVLIANLSFIVNENIDKILIKTLLPPKISATQLGIYGACAKLAVFLSIFVQAFRLGAEPFYFSQANKENARRVYARIMDYFIIGVVLVTVALVANVNILKYFVKGNNAGEQALYWSGLPVVPILLMGYVCLGIYMNLSVWYKLSDQTRFGLYISGVGAVLTIILNVIFIPRYGFMAAAWVSLAAYASMMLLSLYLGNRNYPIPYNLKKNGAYLLAGIICIVLSFVIFKRNLLIGNTIFILLFLITLYAERAELQRIWKRPSK